MAKTRLTFHPLTPDRWDDFTRLFGPRGACAGCWCMWFRLPKAEWERSKGAGNKRAMKSLVDAGAETGILAYAGDEAVGWCAVAPRELLPRLDRSRSFKPLDDRPVWSATCFFVRRDWRGKGVTEALLEAAARHVRRQGGRIVEGYPVAPRKNDRIPDTFGYHGLLPAFVKTGFEVVKRPSATRAIVRRALAALVIAVGLSARAADPPDFRRYVDTIRAKGMTEEAEASLRLLAGLRTGQTQLVMVRDARTGNYAVSYEAAACPRAASDEEARRNAEGRARALEHEIATLRPYADGDRSGFVSSEEAQRFRVLVESGYKAGQVIESEGPSAAALSRALVMTGDELRRWQAAYRELSGRLARAGAAPLPPVEIR